MGKEKLESLFISPVDDRERTVHAARGLGYKFLIEIMPHEEQEECVWFIPNIEELIKTCTLINETHCYRIYPLDTVIDWDLIGDN